MTGQRFNFIGGETGLWRVSQMKTVVGELLEAVEAIEIIEGKLDVLPANCKWNLRGARSYERYATRAEKDALPSDSAEVKSSRSRLRRADSDSQIGGGVGVGGGRAARDFRS